MRKILAGPGKMHVKNCPKNEWVVSCNMAISASLVLNRRHLETSILDFMESSGNMKHKNLFEIVLGSQEAKFSNECSRSVRAKCAALQCKGK